ncbi:MAG TPA: hypothetical protein VMU64_12055 [Acidimicrobiales bacterium]|nr:hypothetical protein [Acidimicrobiales bacterium]
MAISAVFELPHDSVEKYERSFAQGGAIIDHPQRISHVCDRTGDGFTVLDVWEDEESFAALGVVIGPAMQMRTGWQTRHHPVQAIISQDGRLGR